MNPSSPSAPASASWDTLPWGTAAAASQAQRDASPAGEGSELSPIEQSLLEARAAIEAGELHRAEALYADLMAAGCTDLRLFSNLGALALLREQPEIAVGWLDQGLQLDPGNPTCLLNYGMALHKLERSREAIEAIDYPPVVEQVGDEAAGLGRC